MPRCFSSVPSACCRQPIRSAAWRGFAVAGAGASWPVRLSLSIVGSSHFAHGDPDRSANQRANGSTHHRAQDSAGCAAGDFSSVRLFLCRLLCSFRGHMLTPRLSGRCAGAVRRGSTQPDRTQQFFFRENHETSRARAALFRGFLGQAGNLER